MKFKKLFLVGMISVLSVSNVFAATNATVQIGTTKSQIQTEIKNNRTLVPLRSVANLMGLKVDYNQQAKTITLTRGQQTVILKLDNASITINGLLYKIDSAPVTINNSTYLPMRVIAEAFGHTINANGNAFTLSSVEEAEKVLAKGNEVALTVAADKDYEIIQDNINSIIYGWHQLGQEEDETYVRLLGEAIWLYIDAENTMNQLNANNFKLNATISAELDRIKRGLAANQTLRKNLILYKEGCKEYKEINDLLNKSDSSFFELIECAKRVQSSYYYIEDMYNHYDNGSEAFGMAIDELYTLTDNLFLNY